MPKIMEKAVESTAAPKNASLTFVTTDGERIVFTECDMPIGEAVTLASEEALGKIWNSLPDQR